MEKLLFALWIETYEEITGFYSIGLGGYFLESDRITDIERDDLCLNVD